MAYARMRAWVRAVMVVMVCRPVLKGDKPMKRITMTLLAMAVTLLPMSSALSQDGNDSFGFNAKVISGFPTGAAFLTGGGAYNLNEDFLKTGGGFRCLETINQGPLAGCQAGEGIRWDAKEGETQLLKCFSFKCTGAATEQSKTACTDDNTVVMLADFYRQGDGVNESFTAHMFVSEVDQARDLPGIQNVWIEGVGCGTAIANFN
jgi:hypothetical protein